MLGCDLEFKPIFMELFSCLIPDCAVGLSQPHKFEEKIKPSKRACLIFACLFNLYSVCAQLCLHVPQPVDCVRATLSVCLINISSLCAHKSACTLAEIGTVLQM